MRLANRARILSLATAAAIAACAPRAFAVVTFGGTGSNITAFPGNVSQYEGVFDGGYTGTPISRNMIVTATHLNPGATSTFVYSNGGSTSTTYAVQVVATLDDLALWEISPKQSGNFSLVAPIYTGSSELGSTIVDVGRGYTRGSPITGGWAWGSGQSALSWGTNTVSAVPTDTQLGTSGAMGGDFLQFDFDDENSASSNYNPNEAVLTPGDSGGGAFIDVNGVYELAGVNSSIGVRVPVGLTDQEYPITNSAGAVVSATLDDTNGYYYTDALGNVHPIITDIPESSFATRISSKQNFVETVDGTITGSGLADAPIDNDGKLGVYSSLTTGAITGGGSVQIGASGPPVTLQIAPDSGTSQIQGLTLSTGSTLDLTNNSLIICGATAGTSEAWLIKNLASGYANGAWNGPGIDSSTAADSGGTYGVGMIDANDPYGSGLSAGQVELSYALYGDANLDGVVNGIDFMILVTHFNQATTQGWEAGDFTYSGVVNGNDFQMLTENFNKSSFPGNDLLALSDFEAANGITVGSTTVPEPTALLALPLLALALRRPAGRHRA